MGAVRCCDFLCISTNHNRCIKWPFSPQKPKFSDMVYLKTVKQLVQIACGIVVQQLGKSVLGLNLGLSMWTFHVASMPVRICSSVLLECPHGHFRLIGDSKLQLSSSVWVRMCGCVCILWRAAPVQCEPVSLTAGVRSITPPHTHTPHHKSLIRDKMW